MSKIFLFNLGISGLIWWFAVYLVSRNTRSKVAWISAAFLASISTYALANNVSRNLLIYEHYNILWRFSDWSYLLPIALIFHFSVVVSNNKGLGNRTFLFLVYFLVALLQLLITTTHLIFQQAVKSPTPGVGYVSPQGPLFWLIGLFTIIASLGAIKNYSTSLTKDGLEQGQKIKYLLAFSSAALYLITTPIMLYLYYAHLEALTIQLTPFILGLPLIPLLIAILFYRLISDIDYIFNWKEFSYLTITIFLLCTINASLFVIFIAPQIGELAYILSGVFLFVTIFTHGFYDWLTTFVRDLIYNAGKGFSLITDADVADLVRNFHVPEKLETNAIVKFKALKKRTKDGKSIDAAQELTREAIEYLKQPDFPRRTKQNLKYQALKMSAIDGSEEGQIMWELGFEGYPVKIMNGENATRKPLFKVESMSDYTATSRNAYMALRKEALHDLAWRLSYLEKLSR